MKGWVWFSEDPDLYENIAPLQSFMLSCNPETNIFTNLGSISECMDFLEKIDGTALDNGCDAWT